MNKTKTLVWIISIFALCALAFAFTNLKKQNDTTYQQPIFSDEIMNKSSEFSDGLSNPDSVTTYPLDDLGTGIAQKNIYYIDLNKDDLPDRITKIFTETGNAHSYYTYKIEINDNGKYIDITPENLQTTNGEPCDLQQIQFQFKPNFKIITVYREMGDTWNEPTMAYKKVFDLDKTKFKENKEKQMRPVCDVKELF